MISVIIPAYKEYDNLVTLIPEIRKTLNGDLHEIIIVDDDSNDGTEQLENAKVIVRKNERGLSSAVIRGIRECETDAFVVMDGDHQHPPSVLPSLTRALDNHNLVVGSRYVGDGGTSGWTLSRKIVSRIASLMGRPLCGIRDSSSGIFGTYKSLLNIDNLNPIGFKIGLDIYNKLRYESKTEVPYIFSSRKHGDSKFTSKQVKEYLKQLSNLYIDFFNPRQLGKYCLVGSLGVIINFGILIGLTEAFGFHYIVSEMFAIGVVLISNFILNKHWTFKV
jgi:dolichol-phosphate mannosyltransferase